MMDVTSRKRISSLVAWVNSFEIEKKIDNLSQLSDGQILSQCIKFLGFQPDDSVNQPPLEFVAFRLNDFYGCDLTKPGVVELSRISGGEEGEIAKVLVLLLCMAVKHSNNENFIATILSLPDDVQFDLKFFIETTLEQVDSGKVASGDFILDVDGVHSVTCTPMSSLSGAKSCYIASPALQNWLCSPYTNDEATPKISNNQLFESLEVKELKHQLKLMEKELEIQRSLVVDSEGEIELLIEEKQNLISNIAERDERIQQLEGKCEELEELEDIEIKLQKAEEEVKNLKQQLEVAREEKKKKSELQQMIANQNEELKELHQAKNLFQVKLLKYQHQVQDLELECKSQKSQSTRSLKRCNEAVQKMDLLEKQNKDLQDALTKQEEVLAKMHDQNDVLQQQNCTVSNELALLQEQYMTVMCTVGNQGQENERLQLILKDTEKRYATELDAKEQQLKILEEQVTLLTTRVEKMLADSEVQAEEFDKKEEVLKAEWQEKLSMHKEESFSQLTKAEEMVNSCQLTIKNLTRERDEGRILAAEQLASLEVTYKEKVNGLEQQILDCKETAEQNIAQSKQNLLEQELQLKEARECLEQKIEQLGRCHEMISLLEQKLTLVEFDLAKGEEQYQRSFRQHSVELEKLNDEHKLKVSELLQQLEVLSSEHKILVHRNEELEKMTAEKELNYNNLQVLFNKQEKEHLRHCEKMTEEKDKLTLNLKQNQIVAKQQMEVMAKELEQLHNEKVEVTAKYEAYQSVMQQKEISLLCEVSEFKQKNEVAWQKNEQLTRQLEQYQQSVTMLQKDLALSLSKAEEQHQREIKQHSVELEKLNNKHKLKVTELSQQLEVAIKEYEAFTEQSAQQFQEFSKKISQKELEYADLQNTFNKQEKDYLQQFKKLSEEKDKILADLRKNELVNKQQVEQLNHRQEMLCNELKQLRDEKARMAAEYQAYQSSMQKKEVSSLCEVAELKREKNAILCKLEETVGKIALKEEVQNKLIAQIEELNDTLQYVKSEHALEVETYQAAISKGISSNQELETKNGLLLQELNTAKQESLMLAEKLQSCLDTEKNSKSMWAQQVKQLENDLCEVHKQLSSKEKLLQQLSNDIFTSKQVHCKVLSLLEQKKEELVQLETSYQSYRKNRATLLEERESTIASLQSQLVTEKQQNKNELEAVRNENEQLLKSVDKLYSEQAAANSQLEQDCCQKFNHLEQNNIERLEEIAKMQVEMTSLLNELKELKLNHKEVVDCLNVETEKNNLLENEVKQLRVTIKAFEKENARVNKLMVQQKYAAIRPVEDDEQAHLQQLHSEMDQLTSNHTVPLQSVQQDGSSRLEELRARNSFHPPHLKSCYPVELQLPCGTPKSSELQLKGAVGKKSGYFEVSPPRKRNMSHRQQQLFDSPDCTRRRLSAPPTPTSVACKMQLRSYLNNEQDENKPPPSRPSDAFEISQSLDEESRAKLDERKSKMFQRMAASRKSQQSVRRSTTTVTKPLRVRNASKKK